MPTYALICSNDACKHDFEAVSPMAKRAEIACPKCGAADAYTDFGKMGPPPAVGNRPWEHGVGGSGRSMGMAFQADGVADIKRDCPSMKFERDHINPTTVVPVFDNDRHHRTCLKEMGSARERYADVRS